MMIPNATVIAPWCLACQYREQDLSPMSQREKTPKLECQRDNPHVAADGSSWPLTSKYKVEWIFYKQLTLTMLALNEKWNLLTCFRWRINTKEVLPEAFGSFEDDRRWVLHAIRLKNVGSLAIGRPEACGEHLNIYIYIWVFNLKTLWDGDLSMVWIPSPCVRNLPSATCSSKLTTVTNVCGLVGCNHGYRNRKEPQLQKH